MSAPSGIFWSIARTQRRRERLCHVSMMGTLSLASRMAPVGSIGAIRGALWRMLATVGPQADPAVLFYVSLLATAVAKHI